MRCAIIENNKVVNIAEANADFAAAMGWIVSDVAAIGDIYENGDFIKPVVIEDISETKLKKWVEIKSLRDNLTQKGGYKAQGKLSLIHI